MAFLRKKWEKPSFDLFFTARKYIKQRPGVVVKNLECGLKQTPKAIHKVIRMASFSIEMGGKVNPIQQENKYVLSRNVNKKETFQFHEKIGVFGTKLGYKRC